MTTLRKYPATYRVDPLALMHSFDRAWQQSAGTRSVPTNIFETDEAITLEIAAPGMSKDDVDISIEGRQLSIKGGVKAESEAKDEKRHYYLKTFAQRDLSKTVSLPDKVNTDAIEANVQNGVLVVTLPKYEAEQARKISVN